jgi:hypothetical protein
VEQFESARYPRHVYPDEEPVQIPVKRVRREIKDMDMYPRRARDDGYYEEEGEESDDRPPVYRDPRTRYIKRKTPLSTILSILGVGVLVLVVGLYTYVFDSATITIVPKYKDINDLKREITFKREGTEGEGVPFIVATTTLSKTKTLTLSETRKVEAKASGKAIIYNNYDDTPQKLIKNTRFLSSKGKIYRINQSVEVPGKKGGVPGSIEVTLYADSNGTEYNGEATDFTIPGFKGTPRETTFYAKSSGPLTGGSSGNMSLVSLSDLNAAKDALILELDKDIKAETQKIEKPGYVALHTAAEVTYKDNQTEVLNGATSVYTITATGHVMLVDESVFAHAIAKTLAVGTDAPLRLGFQESLTYTRKQSDKISVATTLPILVEGTPRIIWVSDIPGIQEMVEGKKRDEFKPLMKTIDSIESAEIKFSPLWLSSFPTEASKIIVTESLPKR